MGSVWYRLPFPDEELSVFLSGALFKSRPLLAGGREEGSSRMIVDELADGLFAIPRRVQP